MAFNLTKNTFRLLLIVGFLTCTSSVMASPARRIPYKIRLADGTTMTVVKCGDEHKHWLQAADSDRLVIEDGQGALHLATQEEQEAFFATPPTGKMNTRRRVGQFAPVFPTKGKMRSLVLLVNFQDAQMKSPTAREDFQRMMTEERYSELGGTGSARDYYVENSMGAFDPTFDVAGPVTLPHPYAYYGENDSRGDDVRAEQMIIDACRALDDEIDFSEYDYNNDGYIDNVFVFYAGYGEATTSDKNTIWPHSFDITEYTSVPVMLDGKRLDHYACTNELDSEGTMDGIGTFVHEFGHVLGLPDLYSTTGSYAFTPNTWSVMDEGEYNNNSRTPPYFTAFERYSLGWLTPLEVLAEGCQVAINPISTNEAYIIPTASHNEYFLLENRQQEGWDSYIPGHGMLLWHIDYDKYLWERNRVNNTSTHQYVDIVEADNVQSSGTKEGDSFPGTSKVTSITPQTKPALKDWNGNDVNVPLTNIREEQGIIYLDAAGGGAPLEPMRYVTPLALNPTQLTSQSVVANWCQLEDVEGYNVGIGTIQPGSPKTDKMDFTGGLENMPDNWTTNVTSTFSNKGYAGESIPSIRMQQAGDYIECQRNGMTSVSFWCRGSSVKEGTQVEVEWIDAEARVLRKDNYTLTATGSIVSLEAPAGAAQVRISYLPAEGSGSLALDDIEVTYAESVFTAIAEETYTTHTQLAINGLSPDTDYAYYVVAIKGNLRSRTSNYVRFHTPATDTNAIPQIQTNRAPGIYNLQGQRLQTPQRGIHIIDGRKVVYGK